MSQFIQLNAEQQDLLLNIANESIAYGFGHDCPIAVDLCDYDQALTAYYATFVTLTEHNRLRGCIGTLEAIHPLIESVSRNGFSAAFRDPRFEPLQRSEFKNISIEISILSTAEDVEADSEEMLLNSLVPGQDGLIIQEGIHQATFLPSVWEQLPQPKQFLTQLKLKAGLAADYWSQQIRVKKYSAYKISRGSNSTWQKNKVAGK